MPEPPYDRAIALACTLETFRSRWLRSTCACGHSTPHPIRLLLAEREGRAGRSLADTLVRLRCHGCGHPGRMTVHLCQTAHGAGPRSGTVEPGWSLLLHRPASPPEA